MAGVKGRSGGARIGAGAKPQPPKLAKIADSNDPQAFLTSMMNNDAIDLKLRIDAAKALLAHQQKQGKKAKAQRDAATAELGSDWEGLLPEHPAFANFGRL